MAAYEEIIETAIAKMIETVNKDVAIRQARSVPDLDVADNGSVEDLRAPGKDVLREIVAAYSEIMGGVAESLIAYEIRDNCTFNAGDLPENITDHL